MLQQCGNSSIELRDKVATLENRLVQFLEEGLIIAFSGGVDSGFLLWSASNVLKHIHLQKNQGRLLALLTTSPSVPSWEVDEAKQFALSLQVDLRVIQSQELQQEAYAKNDGMRCYYCKSELFTIAKRLSQQEGYRHIAYGYTASDRQDNRFGHLAARENCVHAPLDEAELEKDEIRSLLRSRAITLADKPASPCLASRVMTGVRVTEEKLHHIQRMEAILRDAGLKVYRVRLHEEKLELEKAVTKKRHFRIEVKPEEMIAVLKLRNTLISEAKKMGYCWVTLDLNGYQMGGGSLTP